MSDDIRNNSPILRKAEGLTESAKHLPADSEPRKMADALRPALDLPDQFNAAFVKHGWVFVEFCCGVEPARQALDLQREGKPADEIDAFLADHLINIDPLYWQANKLLGGGIAEPVWPIRAEVVERTFRAYREDDFVPCVPLLLMLIDGFGVSKTGTKSIFSDLNDIDELFEEKTSIGGHPNGLRAVLGHLIRARKGYSEEVLNLPQRNGILHGTRLNYGNKVVAAKALCVLAAVIEWARDTATIPKDEAARKKWNVQFLTSQFARLKAPTPEDALCLLQQALDNERHNEIVALLDYDPLETHLQSKLSECTELLAIANIQIVRQEEWEIFGVAGDREQQARCKVELMLSDEGGACKSRSELSLYATRQAAMNDIGISQTWQIGLSIVGAVRSELAAAQIPSETQ